MTRDHKDPAEDSTAPKYLGRVRREGDDTLSPEVISPKPFAASTTVQWTGQGSNTAEGFVDVPPQAPARVSRRINFAANRAKRVAAARELLGLWATASCHIKDRSFGVYLDEFVDAAQSWMAAFRAVPNEEMFSGILQLVRDAITGDNFLRVQEGERSALVRRVLEIAANHVDLTLEDYDAALGLFLENDIGVWRNAKD